MKSLLPSAVLVLFLAPLAASQEPKGVVKGKELPPQERKIDLTKPFDSTAAVLNASSMAKFKAKFEKTDEGKEQIKIGDKTYDCTWVKGKLVGELGTLKLEGEVKIWVSKTVPLTGLVKVEMKADEVHMLIELTESGNQK